VHARAVVVRAHDFKAAATFASTRPGVPLIIVAQSDQCTRALSVVRGVAPLTCGQDSRPERIVTQARDWLYPRELARPGDRLVVAFRSRPDVPEADTLQVAVLD
jgi:pyruvate kinase